MQLQIPPPPSFVTIWTWHLIFFCNHLNLAFDLLLYLVQEPAGDILVFLTGQDDIDAAIKLLRDAIHDDKKRSSGEFAIFFVIIFFILPYRRQSESFWQYLEDY